MKFPYLVQRVQRGRKFGETPITGVDGWFTFDYMGAAEFEFGTLPAALRNCAGAPLEVKRIKASGPGGHQVAWWVGAGDESFKQASTLFRLELYQERTVPLKECTMLKCAYGLETGLFAESRTDVIGWWDVTDGHGWAFFIRKAEAEAWKAGVEAFLAG